MLITMAEVKKKIDKLIVEYWTQKLQILVHRTRTKSSQQQKASTVLLISFTFMISLFLS
jgi:hypothetical protein